jgi:hypothetical protein
VACCVKEAQLLVNGFVLYGIDRCDVAQQALHRFDISDV